MPFKSEKQRRYLWANEPEIARDWTDTYGNRIQKNNGGIMSIQGGVENYEPSQMVNAPRVAKSSPNHPTAHLAYITPEEQDILIDLNLYGSLKGKPNRGPAGIPSLQGDFGGPGGAYGGHEGPDVSGSRDTGTGNYERSTRPADVAAQKEFDASYGITGSNPKGIIEKGLDFYNQYGLIPNAIKGFKNLTSKWGSGWDTTMGPRQDMGYNPTKNNPFSPRDGGTGEGEGIIPILPKTYTDYYADVDQNLYDDETVDEVQDFIQRFRVDDPYRQQPGTTDTPITYT